MIVRYSRPEMRELWEDKSRFQLWLEVETIALEGMVNLGIAPAHALESVRQKGAFDVERILEIEKEVKHDVIAFLTNVKEHVGEDARFLHFGMTSSDLIDTVFSVQLCKATDIILKGLDELLSVVKDQAMKHKNTVCVGRSHGIHAEPITFGLKVGSWYAELKRQQQRIKQAREGIAVGAISGPVGTFAHLSPKVEEFVCSKLGLKPSPVSTQVISRDIHAALFLSFAQLGATIERIVVEVRHLQRTEVREAEENFTKGQKGSSAMPHKRNPILSENLTGLARMLRSWADASIENVALWHERDISHSSVERVIAPDITITLDFMLARLHSIVKDLQVYPDNMKRNLDLTRGLVYSGTLLVELAASGLSREDAYAKVQKHALDTWDEINSGIGDKTFEDRVKADKSITDKLSAQKIAEIFSLEPHLKHVDFIFNRVFN
ncbi:MAG: adenylosuccinate lyase [Proteobacteria bacterium]|nr:adenylosuccinate lyase [Pseudomonadota bacterium]